MAVAEEEYGPHDNEDNGKGNSYTDGDLLTFVSALLLPRDWWRGLGADGLPERDRARTTQVVVGGL